MQKLSDTAGIKLIGMEKEDGRVFVEGDDRIILTNKRELCDATDFPKLFKNGGLRFQIADLTHFLET